MTTPYYYLMIALLLPYFIAGSSVYFRLKQFGTVNLRQPRVQADELEGSGARLNAAQYNAWEALLIFACAVFVATANNVDPETMTNASMLFIAARACHAIFYVADIAPLRVLSFVVGVAAVFGYLLRLCSKINRAVTSRNTLDNHLSLTLFT